MLTQTVIFDGDCGFCRRQVARIKRLDQRQVFDYLPAQAPDLLERFPQLASENLTSGMRLVRSDGTALAGADAVHAIAAELRGWRHLAWLYRVPGVRFLARAAYGWIAANRQRLSHRSCEDGACSTPPGG